MSGFAEHDDTKEEAHIPTDIAVVSEADAEAGLQRGLKPRHVTMLSIGGVLGTGLFLYSGSALANGGPLGALLGFAIMGSMCWATMISVGEMVAFEPLPGGPITLAARYVDKSFSFTLGWFYWYTWTIFLPSELSALSVLINLWNDSVNNGVWIVIFLLTAISINMLGTRVYGETEFWLSTTKVLLITGLIICGVIISAGGVKGQEPIGFRYWRDPGPFVQYAGISGSLGRFLGFWTTLTQAAFAYIGSEIVAIAAGEAKNPRVSLPRAIRSVYLRIVLFYFGGVFVIGITVSSADERLLLSSGTALASPFVIAIQSAGIKVLPAIVNAGLILSGISAANSELFTSSRALHGLALRGSAPRFFARTMSNGVPVYAVATSGIFATLAFMSLGSTAGEAFGYLATLGSAGGLLMWWGMCFMHTRFTRGLKAQGISRSRLPYHHRLNSNSYAAIYALCWVTVVLFFSAWYVFLKGGWDTATFITSYLPIVLFPITYFGHKLWSKSKLVPLTEMDFSAVDNGDPVEESNVESKSGASRFWSIIA
ncbi:hypothetical protein I317_06848 [Kwoniella heveanensis CBS 569]|nr:hypothetical protein I317_06848 [Kwoniella heveanensis CBS 569]